MYYDYFYYYVTILKYLHLNSFHLLFLMFLNVDDVDNRPSLETVFATAAFYRLSNKRAMEVIDEVVSVVTEWKTVARRARIAAADIELSESAFAALKQ